MKKMGALLFALALGAPPALAHQARTDRCGCHHQYGVRHCHPKLKTKHCEAPVNEVRPAPKKDEQEKPATVKL